MADCIGHLLMGMRRIEIDTFDFIDKLDGAREADDVHSLMATELENFGFTNFLITETPPPSLGLDAFIILNGWSQSWFERYMERRFYRHDPMAKRTRETTVPFFWHEVSDASESREAQQIMDEAASCGLRQGFSVPIFGAAGEQSCVTMGGRQIDIPPRGRAALQLMSIFSYERARALKPQRVTSARKTASARLTAREQEVLKWVARGKTDWEIGEILKISGATSTVHMQNVCRKLGAVSRPQAVAAAIKRREILL